MKRFNKIFRTEAFLGLGFLLALVVLYGYFFLEVHLKWFVERSAFQSIGSEVNIGSIDIDFFTPEIKVVDIQVTNPERPTENIIQIGHILVSFDYKPLLRGSFVSELTNIIQIQFHTDRKRPGRVLSKDKRVLVFKDPTQNRVEEALKAKYDQSILSDLSDLIGGKNSDALKDEYSKILESIKVSDEIENRVKTIKSEYKGIEDYIESAKIKSLLQEVKNFKFDSSSTEASVESTKKASDLLKNLNKEKKLVKAKIENLENNVNQLKSEIKNSPQKFLKDMGKLKALLDPKQLNPDKITESLLSDYFALQFGQVSRVTSSLKNEALGKKAKYVDMVTSKKEEKEIEGQKEDISQGSLEKQKSQIFKKSGNIYVFHKESVLPKFWFKKIYITSKASSTQDIGDVIGYINNFASPQQLINMPMEVNIKGSVPKQGIGGFLIEANIDHRNVNSKKEQIKINLTDYLVKGLKLVSGSKDFINIVKSNSETNLNLNRKDGQLKIELVQTLKQPEYDIGADNKNLLNLFESLKESKEDIYLKLFANGDIKSPDIKLKSNFGEILLDALKDTLKKSVSDLSQKYLNKIKEGSSEKLKPYLQDLNITSTNLADLEGELKSLVDKNIDKLKNENKDKLKKKVEEKLKGLFKKL